jgi:hypothetical protein
LFPQYFRIFASFSAASPVRVVPQRASFVRHSTKKSKKPLADSPRQG